MEVQGRVRYCPPCSGDSCHGSFLSAEERPMTALSVLTEEGNYSSFTLAADARMHWGEISRVSSYFSNRYVSTAQTGQVVDRNSNCFNGWWPCNLHTSCCTLTENNCSIHKAIIVAYNSTPGGIFGGWPWGVFHFSRCSIFISWLIHFLCSFHLRSNEKPHIHWWKFGPYTAPLAKWITNHKDKWPATAPDALLRNGRTVTGCLLEQEKEGDWKDGAVGVILHTTAL